MSMLFWGKYRLPIYSLTPEPGLKALSPLEEMALVQFIKVFVKLVCTDSRAAIVNLWVMTPLGL